MRITKEYKMRIEDTITDNFLKNLQKGDYNEFSMEMIMTLKGKMHGSAC